MYFKLRVARVTERKKRGWKGPQGYVKLDLRVHSKEFESYFKWNGELFETFNK